MHTDEDGVTEPTPLIEAQVAAADDGGQRRSRGPMVTAAAVAVVAIAVGGTIALSRGDTDNGGTPGAQPRQTSSQIVEEPSGGVAPADPRTKFPDPDMPLGPDGQPLVDGLATSGPRFEQGARLLAELLAVVPAGYTVPATDSPPLGPDVAGRHSLPGANLFGRGHQTIWLQKTDGVDVWVSEASLAVSAGPNTGMLIITLTTPGSPTLDDATCAGIDAQPEGSCELVDVGGREVMLLALTDPIDGMQRAAYTHPDGTIVSLMQTQGYAEDGQNPLPQPVFSSQELVALAADDRFHVT